ncbi:MAG TPA: DUF885 domain-containing protein [Acidimicrobiales bacterium]|nr:DUF885 domain-containing protein [Acidimicrobiales bacterium]
MPGVDELLDNWILAEMERDPTRATALGLPGYDHRLGDLSAPAWEARPDEDRRAAAAIRSLDLTLHPVEDQVDLVLVLSELAGRAAMADWQEWRRNPSLYVGPCLDGVHLPWLHRLAPEADLVEATVARLAAVPEVLAAGRANLDPELMPPLFARRGAAAARAGAAFLADLLPAEVGDPGLRQRLAGAAAGPAAALTSFATWLEEGESRSRGDWAIGEARYSALLTDRELLGVDAGQLHQRGLDAYEELSAEMAELARHIDPDAGGWVPLLARLDAECPSTPEEMRAEYERWCTLARDFLAERELVSFPEGERCLVVPSPVFQRPVLAVASYQEPPPFSASRVGHFFVPYPPEGESPEGIAERLASNGYHAIPTTAVHEAYPGHHWHLVWSAQTHRPVRKVVTTSYFVEGWALYTEVMMRREGFFTDPRAVLSHLGARIFRAARIVVDTALHTGGMTPEEAVTFMQEKVAMTRAVAVAEVERYCSWPTQAASYLTGSLQIEALRDRWLAEGRGDLHAFHDAVAADPGLPVALVERRLFPQ